MSKNLSMTMLFDFYGVMLTTKQRKIMAFYYEDDFSLGEISQEINITRQAVLNCLKKCEKKLKELETKLNLVRRMRELEDEIEELGELILSSEMKNEKVMAEIEDKLVEIKNKI